MLAFEVDYLMGRVFAGQYGDRTQSEWPPHPARLFSALASAFFENGAKPEERRALEWLEQLPPACIKAGEPGRPVRTTAFVPTNYVGDNVPVLRDKRPRQFPAQGPSEATVYFIWPEVEPDGEIESALGSLAERTGYLGKACSLVRMEIVKTVEAPNYIPDEEGEETLRVPARGRLEELAQAYELDRRPSPGAMQTYRKAGKEAETICESELGTMLVLRKVGGPGLPIESTLTLTNAVRRALQSSVKDGEPGAQLIHGHNESTHCAIVALPFVEYEHADGHLMGIAIVLPRKVTSVERTTVLRACATVARNGVHIDGIGDWEIDMDDFYSEQSLKARTWTEPSSHWSTVTPILLDRFPKKKGPTVQEIVMQACRRIGLPAPIDIQHGPYSELRGVAPVPAFRLQRKPDERPRWGVHARLRFGEKVRGPVLLGAGRYFGLGLLRPDRVNREQNDIV
jgi:CRISPR-associated protein Csb2